MNDESRPNSKAFREWLDHRHEPPELKAIAARALDACDDLVRGQCALKEVLDQLYAAASHPRFVIWEVGLALLAQLAEQSESARSKIWDLAFEDKAENRRRSVQYLTDGYPRTFCVATLDRLLGDRSAKVRGFSAGRCCSLPLNELLPSISAARANEEDPTTRFELELAFYLMRDNFFEYENSNGYNIVLNFPEEYPARQVWPGQLTREQVSRDGVEAIRDRIKLERASLGILRRPWKWETEASNALEPRKRPL